MKILGRLLILFASGLLTTTAAQSATLFVRDLGDSGFSTLRQTVADAAPGDTVRISVTGAINLFSALIIDKDLTILPAKGVSTSVEGGSGGDSLFQVTAGDVKLIGFTVKAYSAYGFSGAVGSGIRIATVGGGLNVASGARVTLNRMTFEGNKADYGAAAYNYGTLIVLNSTFSNNAGLNGGSGCGAAIGNEGTLALRNVTFANNLSLCGSVLYQNNPVAVTIMANSLLTNQDGNGGATSGAFCSILGGSLVSLGHNLADETGNSCNLAAPGDLLVSSALIGPLGNYGGPTQTHSLLTGSQAIDAGDDALAPSFDQRGSTRPAGAASDIGAFELLSQTPALAE